jgi:P27 family predicted phage terminase small subunit
MGKRGVAKQPMAIAKLKQTFRKDRYKNNMENIEIGYLESIPEPPTNLKKDGIIFWHTILGELIKVNGLMAFTDLPAFGRLCYYYQIMIECDVIIEKVGKTIIDKNGIEKINPNWQISNDAYKNYIALSREFGLTCSSRANIKIEPKKIDEDDYLKDFKL